MKISLQDKRRYVLRFDKGEEVISGLEKFMADQKIKACAFYGLGTCTEAELGYFNVHLKEYRKKPFMEDLEIVSFSGNGSLVQPANKPMVHAHASFSRTDFTIFGGHVFKMLANATCEIFLIAMDGELKRTNNADFNLNLLQ